MHTLYMHIKCLHLVMLASILNRNALADYRYSALLTHIMHCHRAAATSIANWAEEQGGIPLFTIEGDYALQ